MPPCPSQRYHDVPPPFFSFSLWSRICAKNRGPPPSRVTTQPNPGWKGAATLHERQKLGGKELLENCYFEKIMGKFNISGEWWGFFSRSEILGGGKATPKKMDIMDFWWSLSGF